MTWIPDILCALLLLVVLGPGILSWAQDLLAVRRHRRLQGHRARLNRRWPPRLY